MFGHVAFQIATNIFNFCLTLLQLFFTFNIIKSYFHRIERTFRMNWRAFLKRTIDNEIYRYILSKNRKILVFFFPSIEVIYNIKIHKSDSSTCSHYLKTLNCEIMTFCLASRLLCLQYITVQFTFRMQLTRCLGEFFSTTAWLVTYQGKDDRHKDAFACEDPCKFRLDILCFQFVVQDHKWCCNQIPSPNHSILQTKNCSIANNKVPLYLYQNTL